MGKSKSEECSFNCIEASQAHHVGISPQKDRGGTKGTVGKGEGGEEVGCLEANGACCEYAAGFHFQRLLYSHIVVAEA